MKKIHLSALLLPVVTAICFLPGFAEKKPLSIRAILSIFGDTTLYTLAYDTSGRVDSIVYIKKEGVYGGRPDTSVYKFNWQPEKLEVNKTDRNGTTKFIYGLDSQGKAVTLYSNIEYSDTVRFEYDNEGHLVKQTMYNGDLGESSTFFFYNSAGNLTWADGKQANIFPEEYNNYETTIRYSNKVNMGSIQLPLAELILENYNPAMCLASIAGRASAYLPLTVKRVRTVLSQEYERKYTYTFDEEYYPVHIDELLTSNTYQRNEHCYIDITWTETKGVGAIAADGMEIEITGREVKACGAVRAYDMQGRLVASSESGMLTLPSAGIYLLRCGSRSRKVAVP